MASDDPERLYEMFDRWIELMKSDNNILKWTGIDIIGALFVVDEEHRMDHAIPHLVKYVHGGHLITCNHAIVALARLANHRQDQRSRILDELLAVKDDTFETEDCRAIAMGKVLESLDSIVDEIKKDTSVRDFIREAQKSYRKATRKKADRLLKKLDKEQLKY